jgi:hypothetical protein
MFAIFDLGRYAITMQSLRMLANAGARAVMISYDATNNTYTGCTGDPLPSVAAKKAVAPFLYSGGLTPTLGSHCTYCYGVSTRFHHVNADRGPSIQCAEREPGVAEAIESHLRFVKLAPRKTD